MQRVRVRSQEEVLAEIRHEQEKIQALQVSLVEWRITIEELKNGTAGKEDESGPVAGGAWNTRSA